MVIQHGGFLLGSPLGVTARAPGMPDPAVRIKCADFEPGCSGGITGPSFGALPGDWLLGSSWDPNTDPAPIQAMSIGIDIFQIDRIQIEPGEMLDGTALVEAMSVAVLSPPPEGWLAIQLAVEGREIVDPKGDPVRGLAPDVEIAVLEGDVDASVFSFLVPGSNVSSDPEGNVTVRALSPDALDLVPGDAIDGLNMHMAMYDSGLPIGPGSSFFTGTLPANPTVYFTLRDEFMAHGGFAGWTGSWTFGSHPPRGAVLESTWDGAMWGLPKVAWAWSEISPGASSTNIDGLAIARDASGDPVEMLFSTVDDPAEDQLRSQSLPLDGYTPRRVVFAADGGYDSAGIKIGAGKGIGDFCTKDPGNQRDKRAVLDDFFVARRRPRGALLPGVLDLSVSGFRQLVAGVPGLRTCMDWRPNGPEPRGERGPGTALVLWGMLEDYATSPSFVPDVSKDTVTWMETDVMPFEEAPLVAERKFPKSVSLPTPEEWRHALVAQWMLVVDGRAHVGPLVVLRMWRSPPFMLSPMPWPHFEDFWRHVSHAWPWELE